MPSENLRALASHKFSVSYVIAAGGGAISTDSPFLDFRDSKSYLFIFQNPHPTLKADITIKWFVDPTFLFPVREDFLRVPANSNELRIQGTRWAPFCRVTMVVPQQGGTTTTFTIWAFGQDLILPDNLITVENSLLPLNPAADIPWSYYATSLILAGAEAALNGVITQEQSSGALASSFTVPAGYLLNISSSFCTAMHTANASVLFRIRYTTALTGVLAHANFLRFGPSGVAMAVPLNLNIVAGTVIQFSVQAAAAGTADWGVAGSLKQVA